MRKYKIIIDTPAQNDIINIVDYIRNSLYAEKAASDFYSELKEKNQRAFGFPRAVCDYCR